MDRPTVGIHDLSPALTALILLSNAVSVHAAAPTVLADKTLVAWVAPANLTEQGGGVLSLEKEGGIFDAIVFGEIAPGRWMAGSNSFRRTQQEQQTAPAETTDAATSVQIAIVYRGKQITIYRNGRQYADYMAPQAERFSDSSTVLMGLRHTGPKLEGRFFSGSVDDARIYNVALDERTIAALQPNETSDPEPLAWWTFENGVATDRRGTFASTTLVGEARIEDGKLHLDQPGSYLLAAKAVPTVESGINDNQIARALREHLLTDPHRPGYHFVIPEGRGMPFDPNGAIFWKGRYHLFYIFQDERGHNWGHVSSTDLFHWRHHPTGLVSGMFSGNCFVNKEGRPTMCYHQVGQGNALAVALDDDLEQWQKLDSNPITPQTQEGDPHHGVYRSWDPFGWVEGDSYYAIFGGQRPAVAKSNRLAGPWQYVGDLMANTVAGVSIDEDVSCADLFPLGDRHVLLCISHRLGCRYYLGDWQDEQFHPTFHQQMSWTDHAFFAPESLVDDRGRRIMWAWLLDRTRFQTRMDYGWSGTMGLPRVLSLANDGTLRIRLPEEIERLRYNGQQQQGLTVPADAELPLAYVRGNSIELAVEMQGGSATQFGVKVCCSPDDEEQTLVYYDTVTQKLTVDTRKSSTSEGPKSVEAGPLALKEGEPLRLRVFVDKSVVEVFANDRQAVMRRIYPSRPDSLGVKLFSQGGPCHVTKLQAWDMMPSNPY